MKKPIYPSWVKIIVAFICLIYITHVIFGFTTYSTGTPYEVFLANSLSGVFLAVTICLLSALLILREKESLYITVFLSFMILFFNTAVGIGSGAMGIDALTVYIVLLLLHFVVLVKLSYICFGAIIGGGSYKKKTKNRHKDKHKNKK